MADWEYCSCPYCGNTLRLRPNQAEVGIPCPVCYRPVKLSEALAYEAEQEEIAARQRELELESAPEPDDPSPGIPDDDPADDEDWEIQPVHPLEVVEAGPLEADTLDPDELGQIIVHPFKHAQHADQVHEIQPDQVEWSWPMRQELPPKADKLARAKPAPAQSREYYPEPASEPVRESTPDPARDQPRAMMAAALAAPQVHTIESNRLMRVDWREEDEEDGEFEENTEPGEAEGEEKTRKLRKRRFGLWGETPMWETSGPRSRAKDFISKHLIRAGLAVLGIFIAILVANMFATDGRTIRMDPNAQPARRFAPMVGGKPAAANSEGEVKALHDALIAQPEQLLKTLVPIVEKFLRSPTWRDKLEYARDPQRVGPLMEKYYSVHPDKPVDFIAAGSDKSLAYKNNLLVLNVLMRDYEVRQIALEYKDGDFRVDWESFVGYGVMDPSELKEKRPVDPTLVRVSVSAALPGYFNYAFTDEQELECYVITFPDESYAFGYVEKTTPVASAARNLLSQSNTSMAVLTVRYPEGSVVGDQFWIHEVIAEGWVTGAREEQSNP